MASRAGRRRGASTARDDILAAARDQFADRGYDAVSLRAIAEAAGVDVALVSYYFGSKADLFVASSELPVRPGEIIAAALRGDPASRGEQVATAFLSVWDSETTGRGLQSVFRSSLSRPAAAQGLAEFVRHDIIDRVAATIDRPDAERRASLVATQMVGLAVLRYVLRIEPIASLDSADVAAGLAPVIQRLLTGD